MIIKWIVILLSFLTPAIQESVCPVSNTLIASRLDIEGDDFATSVQLPFSFNYFCNLYDRIGISTNFFNVN